MSPARSSLAQLAGVVLIAGGIAVAFVTGFDPLYLALGLVGVIAGIALIWRFYTKPEGVVVLRDGQQRSVQKPLDSGDAGRKFKDRI